MSGGTVAISDLGHVVTGKTPSTKNSSFFDGEYQFVTPSDLDWKTYYCHTTERTVTDDARKSHLNQFIPSDTVMVTCIGNTIGKCGLSSSDCLTNQQINSIIPRDGIDPKFVYYLLVHNTDAIRGVGLGGGSATPILNKTSFSKIKLRVPPQQQWSSIANTLSAYDDLIENNRRRIQLLEQAARLLYKEWFLHLRFPGHEHIKIVDGVPEGWSMRPIKDVVEGVYDGPHATPPAADEGPIFLGIKNITESGRLDLASKRCISEADFPNWTRRVTPQADDIVFSYEATLNLYALIPEGFRGCLGRRLALVRPIASDRTGSFIYFSFLGHRWRTVIEQNRLCGATVDRVPIAKFPDFPLLMPPRRLVAAFDDHVLSLLKQMETLERENELLAKARDLLLPKLMKGEIVV